MPWAMQICGLARTDIRGGLYVRSADTPEEIGPRTLSTLFRGSEGSLWASLGRFLPCTEVLGGSLRRFLRAQYAQPQAHVQARMMLVPRLVHYA